MKQIYVGIVAEGPTDYRFLKPILTSTLIKIAFECKGQIDIDVLEINCEKGKSFNEFITNASRISNDNGIDILVVHTDADSSTIKQAIDNKIKPLVTLLQQMPDTGYCKIISPLIPVAETEAWMLADKIILKKIIGTEKSDNELGISGNPEKFSDPKRTIENAIFIGRQEFPKKIRYSLDIAHLYEPLGTSISLEKLAQLESFKHFETNLRQTFKDLKLII